MLIHAGLLWGLARLSFGVRTANEPLAAGSSSFPATLSEPPLDRLEVMPPPEPTTEPTAPASESADLDAVVERAFAELDDAALPETEPAREVLVPIELEPRTAATLPIRRRPAASTPVSTPVQSDAPSRVPPGDSLPPVDRAPAAPAVDSLVQDAATEFTVTPTYPRQAVTLHLEGEVVLLALVKADGTVNGCEIESSSGHDLLDDAAKAALLQWRFKPHVVDGLARPFTARIPFQFFIPKK